MQRGRRIFDKLNYGNEEISKKYYRGRSTTLIDERNRCLLYRYWYYSKRHKMRYDNVLKQLRKEFYLSEMTIVNVIGRNSTSLKKVYEENPPINKIKTEFEHLSWK